VVLVMIGGMMMMMVCEIPEGTHSLASFIVIYFYHNTHHNMCFTHSPPARALRQPMWLHVPAVCLLLQPLRRGILLVRSCEHSRRTNAM
jgi:hypothetical protein